MWEIRNSDGTYKTLEEIKNEVREAIVDELDDMSNEDALCLGNHIREYRGDNPLHENSESEINEVFSDWSAYDLLNMDYDDYSDFFYLDWGDPEFTDDVWEGIDTDELAMDIMKGETFGNNITWTIADMVVEYNQAKEYLENMNKYRTEGENLLAKFTNCEADVTDLLQYIDRLTKTDEAWRKGV